MSDKDKIKQANKNIKYLIDKILKYESEFNKCYCCKFNNPNDVNSCESDCDECKEQYYKDLKEEIFKEYCV